MHRFDGDLTRQEGLPDAAIERAVALLRNGRLHRYQTGDAESEAAALEREFAAWQGAPYCLACTSGGYALFLALKAYGLTAGQRVLTNAYTLAPVPGAIVHAGGEPVLVECDGDTVIDLADLERKIQASGARVLMLSHMRGHLVDMDALMALINAHGVDLIEDCAHTMGARWNGERSGNFGLAACFSTQTYKHINSGEGGLLVTRDADLLARATVLSGSYMLYERHGAGPDATAFAGARYEMPNCSGRLDELRAAILRPQLPALDAQVDRWARRYRAMEAVLQRDPTLRLRTRPDAEHFVGSSLQFRLPSFDRDACQALVAAARERGVELKWFGAEEPHGYTSQHSSWRYMATQTLPETGRVLSTLFDLRIPLTVSEDDCRLIGEIIASCVESVSP
ncbi:MAG: aminotransferase class I/II-fold pyridoxal phosphate-dependent enzyme [Pseudomonadota bacterium]